MIIRLRQQCALECPVCRQFMCMEQDKEDKGYILLAALFGAARYRICCHCGQEMEVADRNYKRRWERRFRRIQKSQEEGAIPL